MSPVASTSRFYIVRLRQFVAIRLQLSVVQDMILLFPAVVKAFPKITEREQPLGCKAMFGSAAQPNKEAEVIEKLV